MAINIKNPSVERLVAEVVALTGESKTEAVGQALRERKERLQLSGSGRDRGRRFLQYLASEIWPSVPDDQLGRRLSRQEEDEILGLGRDGA